MAILNGIITVLLVVTALILIVTVLLQPGESNGLGAIAGGAETFFGKEKASTMDKMLSKMPEGVMDDYLPGGCEQSARLDVAYTTTRACERAVVAMDRRYAAPELFKQYINRLSDYLFLLQRQLQGGEEKKWQKPCE